MDEQGPDGSLPDAAGGNGPPRQVRIVAYLMLVNAAVALLSLVATLVTPIADYQATVTRLDPTLTADQANALANDIFRYHLAVAAVLLVANVGLSLGVRRGFSWARMASLLLTGMSLIVTVSGGTGGGAVAGLLTLVVVAVDVGIIALLATRGGRAYFRRARPGRSPRPA